MQMRLVLLAAMLGFAPAMMAQILPGTPMPKEQTTKPVKRPEPPGQPAPATPVEDMDLGKPIQINPVVVLVPTTVTTRGGSFVNGLQPQDFTLLDNEKEQKVNADVTFLPLSLVVCIQRSANIEVMLPKIRKMGNLMHDMVVGDGGEAAIISFDHRIELLQDFTDDADKINAAVQKLKPGGQNSRLNDAILQASRLLRHKKDRRKVILLISETLDRSSQAHPKEVLTELQMNNIDVFTLNINRLITRLTEKPQVPRPDPFPAGARPLPGIASPDPTTVAQVYGSPGNSIDFVPVFEEIFRAVKAIFVKNPAEVYTSFTGGREYGFITEGGLEKALAQIGSEIRSQYILSYSPNNKLDGGWHRIQVKVNRPGVRVRTRPGYWMAARPD